MADEELQTNQFTTEFLTAQVVLSHSSDGQYHIEVRIPAGSVSWAKLLDIKRTQRVALSLGLLDSCSKNN